MAVPLTPFDFRRVMLRGYVAAADEVKAREVITRVLEDIANQTWDQIMGPNPGVTRTWAEANPGTVAELAAVRARMACLSIDAPDWEAEVFGLAPRSWDGDEECGRSGKPNAWGDAYVVASTLRQVDAIIDAWREVPGSPQTLVGALLYEAGVKPLSEALPEWKPDLPLGESIAGLAVAAGGAALFTSSKPGTESRALGGILALLGGLMALAAPRIALARARRKTPPASKGDTPAGETEGE